MFNKFDDTYFKRFLDRRSEYNIPEIEQIDLDDVRLYVTPSGLRYPSMSTVTKLLSGDSIAQWRARVGSAQADIISRRAAKRGTSFHTLSEHYVLGEQELFKSAWRKAMPDAHANWAGMKEHLDEHLTEVRASECRLYSDRLRLSGTTDLIGVYKGKLCVIDFKTSSKWKERSWIDGYFLQCDGYGDMWQERTGETPDSTVILMATDGHREPQVFEEPYGKSLGALAQLRLEFYRKFSV